MLLYCAAAVGLSVYCAGASEKIRTSVAGWNRPDCGQDGAQTHTHAFVHTQKAPFVAVTKGRP